MSMSRTANPIVFVHSVAQFFLLVTMVIPCHEYVVTIRHYCCCDKELGDYQIDVSGSIHVDIFAQITYMFIAYLTTFTWVLRWYPALSICHFTRIFWLCILYNIIVVYEKMRKPSLQHWVLYMTHNWCSLFDNLLRYINILYVILSKIHYLDVKCAPWRLDSQSKKRSNLPFRHLSYCSAIVHTRVIV